MAWTTPRCWTTGEVVTAAIMNAHVRDNLNVTSAGVVTAAGDITYASASHTMARLAKGTDGNILHQASCIPAWTASPSLTGLTLSGALDVNGTIDYDGTDVDMLSSGDIDLVSSANAAAAIYIAQSTGTSGTIKIHADTGTSVTEGAESINILSDVGGVGIRSTANLANAINLTVDGGTTSSMTLFNDQGTSVTEGGASIELLSDAGGVELRSTANLVNAINLTVDGGTTSTMTLFNDQGTTSTEGAASIQLLSDVGGIGIKSGLNAAGAIRLTADAGTSETIILHADQGSGTGSICLTSDAGGITLNPATFITVGANATNAAEVRMFEDTDNGCNYVALKAPNVSTSYTITLPTAVAASCGLFLKSTCAGVTSWAAAGGGLDSCADAIINNGYGIVLGNCAQLAGGDNPANTVAEFQMVGTACVDTSMHLIRHSTDAEGFSIRFGKSRNATIGSNTIVAACDIVGDIVFMADDGSDMQSYVAAVRASIDGTPGNNDMPGRISLFTTADAAAGVTERLRVSQCGAVSLQCGSLTPATGYGAGCPNADAGDGPTVVGKGLVKVWGSSTSGGGLQAGTHNVTSVAKCTTGVYDVTIATDFPGGAYKAQATARICSAAFVTTDSYAAGTFKVYTRCQAGNAADKVFNFMMTGIS